MGKGARTRFAPSPTGDLHIGGARTALFNWLHSRQTGGKFILRIEDTDPARSSAAFETSILDDLSWLGLEWDEGPDKKGGFGPYRQSERLDIYGVYSERLLASALAYPCYCTKERLQALKETQIRTGLPPRYDNRCRGLASPPPDAPAPAIRFKVERQAVDFIDGVHGPLSFDAGAFGDFVIMGSDNVPSYNFAAAIDDALMEITDIIRGDDHISNTPRQLLILKALKLPAPAYSHIPLVLAPDRTPLSKRDSSASLKGLRSGGYLPGAVINAIARLGWSPGEGFMTLDELSVEFSINRLSKSPSVFDLERLKHFNKIAIERLEVKELLGLAGVEEDREAIEACEAVRPNAATLLEFKDLIRPFIAETISPDDEALAVLNEVHSKAVIREFKEAILNAPAFDDAAFLAALDAAKKATGEKGRRLFMPIRAALTGQTEGIELARILRLLGRQKTLGRLGRWS